MPQNASTNSDITQPIISFDQDIPSSEAHILCVVMYVGTLSHPDNGRGACIDFPRQ